jgi:inosine/xanthosine triphosphatase
MTPSRRIIAVGSTNPVKLEAVRLAFTASGRFGPIDVRGRETTSGVREQPITLNETLRGATTRARSVFANCDLSVGIEDGLFAVPQTQSGYMNVCACVIFDGTRAHVGLASAFEYPAEVTRFVIDEGLDVTQAFVKAGLSNNARLGAAEGAIGVLTRGRLTRRDYARQAVDMALLHVPNLTSAPSKP